MIETISLLPGITLRCCRDTRFKQGCLTLQLVRPMAAEESAMNALIPAVLLRGTRRHPDLRSITQRLDELYGAALGPMVRRVGDYVNTGISLSFMDDRFALPGDRVLEPMLDFLGEILLDYPVENQGFLADFVESEKVNLISTIEAERNDKRIYTMNQMLRKLCSGDAFGLPRLGEKEQVAAVTPQGLLSHYRRILSESPIELFYVGSAEPRLIAGKLAGIFEGLSRNVLTLPPQTGLQGGETGDFTETMEVSQGKLSMGFYTPITNRMPQFPAMQILNTVFGAGMTSKLFMQVREKLSLCYSIGSSYYGTKGIVVVNAGVDFDKMDLTREEILRQLDLCRQGHISDEELKSAREALLSGLRATHDSPGAIESYYATAALSGMPLTAAQYAAAVESVTREDVAAAAQTLQLRVSYFLRGEDR